MSSLAQSWHQPNSQPTPPSSTVLLTQRAPPSPSAPLTRPSKPTPDTAPRRQPLSKRSATERKKWSSAPAIDLSKIRSKLDTTNNNNNIPLTRPKRTMPVSTTTSKLRAKSLGTSGFETKARTPEEVNIEMMALRKELVQSKEEGNLLKCRIRKMEEEHNKKMKQLERSLATAKKESSEHEKKRESSAESVTVLRQKCQKLEHALKDQEAAIKKLQNSNRPARPTELKGLVVAYSPNNSNTSHSNGAPAETRTINRQNSGSRGSGPSPAIANELSRLRDSIRKLQSENLRLQQQLKEKNDELRQAKQQALRSRTTKAALSGSSSAPSALGRRSMPAALRKPTPPLSEAKINSAPQQRISHSSVHRTTTLRQPTSSSTTTSTTTVSKSAQKTAASTNSSAKLQQTSLTKKTPMASNKSSKPSPALTNGSKPVVKKTPNHKAKEPPQTPSEAKPVVFENGSEDMSGKELDPRVVDLQKKVAAKKIQRTWRDHHQKVLQNQAERHSENGNGVTEAGSIEEIGMEEDVEYLQSVIRGHQERLQYVSTVEDAGTASAAELKQALNVVQAAHQEIWNQRGPQEE